MGFSFTFSSLIGPFWPISVKSGKVVPGKKTVTFPKKRQKKKETLVCLLHVAENVKEELKPHPAEKRSSRSKLRRSRKPSRSPPKPEEELPRAVPQPVEREEENRHLNPVFLKASELTANGLLPSYETSTGISIR